MNNNDKESIDFGSILLLLLPGVIATSIIMACTIHFHPTLLSVLAEHKTETIEESWNWRDSPVLKAYRDVFILFFLIHGILEINTIRTKQVNKNETEKLNQPAIAQNKFTVGTVVRLKSNPERLYYVVETFTGEPVVKIMTFRSEIGLQIARTISINDLSIVDLPHVLSN